MKAPPSAVLVLLLWAAAAEECPSGQHEDCDERQGCEADEQGVVLLQTSLAHTRKRRPESSGDPGQATWEDQALPPSGPAPRATVAPMTSWRSAARKEPFPKLPPCKQRFWLARLAAQSAAWCDPTQVPASQRAPPKLQGLYWLGGSTLPAVAACFSRGRWDEDRLRLRLSLWSDFVFRDGRAAERLQSAAFAADVQYSLQFHDANLSRAVLRPQGQVALPMSTEGLDALAELTLAETGGLQAPGEKWQGEGNVFLWRVLDGGLRVLEANEEAMLASLDPSGQGLHLARHSRDCVSGKACSRDTGGSCRALRCPGWRGRTECVNYGLAWRCMCLEGHCAVNGRCVHLKADDVVQAEEQHPGTTA